MTGDDMRWSALTLHELADRIAFTRMSEWVKLLRLCGASMRDAVCAEIGRPDVQSQKTNSTIRKLITTDNKRASKHIRLRGPRNMPTHKVRVNRNDEHLIVAQPTIFANDASITSWRMTAQFQGMVRVTLRFDVQV